MKKGWWVRLVHAVLLGGLAVATAAPPVRAAEPARHAAFDRLKSLVGSWDGVADFGKEKVTVTLSIKTISRGTALMETLTFTGESEMVTVYHPVGDQVMLTHYCSSNTQPRMRTDSIPKDVRELFFKFLDATNMMNSTVTAMHNLKVVFLTPTQFRQEWYPQDSASQPVVITYRRK